MGALQAGLLRHAGHGARFFDQLVFKIGAFEGVACVAQRAVQVKRLQGAEHLWRQGHFGGDKAACGGHRLRAGHRSDCGQAVAHQALFHGLEQFLQGDGFFQKGQRADLGGFDCGFDGGVAAHHDHRHGQGAAGRPFLEQGDAIGIGHPDVEQDQVRALAQAGGAGLRGVFGQLYGVALVIENFPQQIAYAVFVVNHQNVCHDLCAVR